MRKAHALHNEELCNFLLPTKKYNDWVITTAFYSALNFVKHQIFPFDTKGKGKYDTFEQWYKVHGKDRDKHEALSYLVAGNTGAGKPYKWLLDACKGARYVDYMVSDELASKSKRMLDAVKSHCPKLAEPPEEQAPEKVAERKS